MKRLCMFFCAFCLVLSACGDLTVRPQNGTASLREQFLAKADAVQIDDTTVTFTDAVGETVTLEKNPASVICMHTSLTTLWYEAGGTLSGCIASPGAVQLYEEYIGRDITADAGMNAVAASAAAKNWNVEGIIARRPSLIICATSMSGYSTLRAPAQAAGIPLLAAEYNDFSDYLKWFKVFCHLSGHPELWESVAVPALDAVLAVIAACPAENPPRVFSMFASTGRLQANTSATVVGGMIGILHGENITDVWDKTGVQRLEINPEALYAADPDVILVQCHADLDITAAQALVEDMLGENPVWLSLRAVREGRVYYLEKNLFHNKPNSRFADAYRTLAEYLYPQRSE